MIIYKITNLVNGKLYFGQTVTTLRKRWKKHLQDSKKSKCRLYRAMRKHGVENFTAVEVVSALNKNALDSLEIEYIKNFNTMDPDFGYNMDPGGRSNVGIHISQEAKDKRSELNRIRGNKAKKNLDGLKKFHEENPEFLSNLAKEKRTDPKFIDLVRKNSLRQFSNMENRDKASKIKGSKLFHISLKETGEVLWEGFNQCECARQIGVNQGSISNWVSGKTVSEKYLIIKLE